MPEGHNAVVAFAIFSLFFIGCLVISAQEEIQRRGRRQLGVAECWCCQENEEEQPTWQQRKNLEEARRKKLEERLEEVRRSMPLDQI